MSIVSDTQPVPERPAPASVRALWSAPLLWCLACIATVTAILYWRRPDAFYNPQLWAEDGYCFFSQAFSRGIEPLLWPYAGYFHTLARLVAWVGSWMSVRYVPHWYVFAAWAMIAAMIGYTFSARFPFSNGPKFLMGLALVATSADNEVFFNLANWATVTGLLWLLLAVSDEPRSRLEAAFDFVLLLLAGLSSPFAVCLWPTFLLRWGVRRSGHSSRMLVLSLLVALVQVWNMVTRVAGDPVPTFSLLFLDGLIFRFGFMFLGERAYALHLTSGLRVCGAVLLFGLYGSLFWYAVARKRWAMLTVLGGGIAAAVLSLYVIRHNPVMLMYSSGRHFYIPAVTLAWALLLLDRHWRWLPLGTICVAFLFLTPGSKNQVLPDLDWAGHTARCTGTQPECRIPINPVRDPPMWFATMKSRVFDVPPMQTAFASRFDDELELLGYDAVQNDGELSLSLVWRALNRIDGDLKFFVHLYSPDHPTGILTQLDAMPLDWQYPTSHWVQGEVVVDRVVLSLDALEPGEYRIAVGWYDADAPAMARLVAYDARGQLWEDHRAVLPLIVVVPQ